MGQEQTRNDLVRLGREGCSRSKNDIHVPAPKAELGGVVLGKRTKSSGEKQSALVVRLNAVRRFVRKPPSTRMLPGERVSVSRAPVTAWSLDL